MARSDALRRSAGGQINQRLKCERRNGAVQKAHVDPLTLLRALTCEKREQYSLKRIHPRHDVGNGNADLGGRLTGIAGEVHESCFALSHDVVTRPGSIRSCLAESRHGTIDHPWISSGYAVVAET